MTTNVLNLPGNYKIISSGSSGTVYISADTVLGVNTDTNTVKVNAEFISSLNPRDTDTHTT